MVIFLNEEGSYLSWVSHHAGGFVLDWLRKPTKKKPTIHRARCAAIRKSKTRRTHWTTGRHLKACSLDLEELASWAEQEAGSQPEYCGQCAPTDDSTSPVAPHRRHLTKLGKEIVDYVLETAVIHLDQEESGYELTVEEVARCLDKTPAQITSALLRLVEDGYLRLQGESAAGTELPANRQIRPTEDTLRTVPAFENMSQRKLRAELDNLTDEENH